MWAALVPLLALGALAGCGGSSGSSSSASGSHEFTGNAYPGVDLANTRAPKSPIETGNVTKLKEVWALPLKGQGSYGSYASTPVVANGVIYSQDLASNVQAVDLETGEVLWSKDFEWAGTGPNGLAVADGHVYGTTPEEAFALNQETGKEEWSVALHGNVDMAPATNEGIVYVSTVPETPGGEYEAGAAGTLFALDGKTGKKLWTFDTVPKGLWGAPKVNSGGGVWYTPSFDGKGSMYFGTGNPSPSPGSKGAPFAASRPGPNLYTDSLVKLNAKTGKLEWYYQQTPHDLYNWDFQDSPVLVSAKGRELAIGAGKGGVVVAVDAKTGKPVWKTPVGIHNGHDKDSLYAMRGETSKIKTGEVFPGQLGGVIAPMSSDGKRVYVPVVNHSLTLLSGTELTEEGGSNGEIVAIDVATGKVAWVKELTAPAYGATLVANDVVFATDAEGLIHALKAETGGELWQASLPAGTNAGVMVSGDMLLAGAGLPVAEGQVPKLVAYKLGK